MQKPKHEFIMQDAKRVSQVTYRNNGLSIKYLLNTLSPFFAGIATIFAFSPAFFMPSKALTGIFIVIVAFIGFILACKMEDKQ